MCCVFPSCVWFLVCGVYTYTYVSVRKHVRTSRRSDVNGDRNSRPKFGELGRNSDENFARLSGVKVLESFSEINPEISGNNPVAHNVKYGWLRIFLPILYGYRIQVHFLNAVIVEVTTKRQIYISVVQIKL